MPPANRPGGTCGKTRFPLTGSPTGSPAFARPEAQPDVRRLPGQKS